MDGIEGTDSGTRKFAGVLVSGSDPVAGLDPARVSYLAMTDGNGQTKEENVKQIVATVRSVATRFAVIPQFESLRLT